MPSVKHTVAALVFICLKFLKLTLLTFQFQFGFGK
jgi:hypothetical protein